MVTSHGKFRPFVLDKEIIKVFLLRELITEAYTIVIYTETNNDVTLAKLLIHAPLAFISSNTWLFPALRQRDSQFIIVVADITCFAPNGLPCFVERRCLRIGNTKTIHQVTLVCT